MLQVRSPVFLSPLAEAHGVSVVRAATVPSGSCRRLLASVENRGLCGRCLQGLMDLVAGGESEDRLAVRWTTEAQGGAAVTLSWTNIEEALPLLGHVPGAESW